MGWAIAALGIVIGWTGALDIIHEIFHVLVGEAQGMRVDAISWNQVQYWGTPTIIFFLAGYVGEYILYSGLAVVFATGGKPRFAWFWYGILAVVTLHGMNGKDFHVHINANFGGRAADTVVILWIVLGIAGLLVLQYIIRYYQEYYRVLRQAKEREASGHGRPISGDRSWHSERKFQAIDRD